MGCCCGKLEERVNDKFTEDQIIAKEIFWANLEYQRSTGCCQIKGNGALVLTSEVLWFNLLCPNTEIEMPLRNIRTVQAVRGGLVIDFVDAYSGIEDQVVIMLNQPQSWKRIIDGKLITAENMGSLCATLEERVNKKFPEGQIIGKEILWANLRFQKSAGKFPIQGNGALVLTSDVLWFTLLLPEKQIEMPLQDIRSVQVGRIKRKGEQPSVFVDFVDATSGIEDRIVITLREPWSWKEMIDEATERGFRF